MTSQMTKLLLALCVCVAGVMLGANLRTAYAAAGDTKKIELPGVTAAAESAADKVFITSQPTQETFDALAQKGVKMVINMRRADEMAKLSFDEKTAAKNAGMEYINIPMNTALPKQAEVDQILSTLAKSKDAPVLLHCSSGNRAGAIWALYSGANNGLTPDDAIAEGKVAGLTNEALEHVVRNRIIELQKK